MVFAATLVAVNVVISRIFIIPVPMTHGYINLCDALILVAAMLMGSRWGAAIGGFSGLLLDLLGGYGQYMFFSLIVHGLEGWCAGYAKQSLRRTSRTLILLGSGLLMVLGYFVTDWLLYSWPAGVAGILPNMIQGLVGVVLAMGLLPRLERLIH
nr:ECF transporter S component [Levilactobacillus bambusae]